MSLVSDKLKALARCGAAGAYYAAQVHRWRHRGKVIILMYHRVLAPSDLRRQNVQPGMYVRDTVFRSHMEFVKANFKVIALEELLDRWHRGAWDNRSRFCVVTFDDGWLDNYRHAYPVLKELGLPATIFLPTDFVGTPNWFWPDLLSMILAKAGKGRNGPAPLGHVHAALSESLGARVRAVAAESVSSETTIDRIIAWCKELPLDQIGKLIENLAAIVGLSLPQERVVVNWEEVKEMSQNGLSFGSHSCSHGIMTKLSRDEVVREVTESRQVLLASGASFVPVFCYPNGNSDKEIQQVVQASGYEAALGVKTGIEGSTPANWFDIARIGIHNDISYTIPLFSFRIFGPTPAAA